MKHPAKQDDNLLNVLNAWVRLLEMNLSRYQADETDDNRYLDNTDTNYPPMEAIDDEPYDTRKMRQQIVAWLELEMSDNAVYQENIQWYNHEIYTRDAFLPYILDNRDWPLGLVKFSSLEQNDIRQYLKHLGAVKHVDDDDDKIMNERNLITNRLERLNIIADDTTSICPKHRSSLGIGWFQSKQCYHPDHDPKSPAHSADCRPASLDVSSSI
ncbi:unnamed protein product [Didymodactylos carnosus]|uniref:Uncharacterized protein n=1 Tax=Didymodactylos carnosus TaxID=1234261 RepID=A0A8S2DMS2_9BILA|nr:unnamed protein product [Didymodactylos carnosus]CAF3711018.1 unnamed protein product [Didymodactylos carnosus]